MLAAVVLEASTGEDAAVLELVDQLHEDRGVDAEALREVLLRERAVAVDEREEEVLARGEVEVGQGGFERLQRVLGRLLEQVGQRFVRMRHGSSVAPTVKIVDDRNIRRLIEAGTA